ncbi:hypothetical protein BLOT_002944 [Blomia tropicalis]|nr:hypothetical protein BLOT_002944 [Blomia tropicalis]
MISFGESINERGNEFRIDFSTGETISLEIIGERFFVCKGICRTKVLMESNGEPSELDNFDCSSIFDEQSTLITRPVLSLSSGTCLSTLVSDDDIVEIFSLHSSSVDVQLVVEPFSSSTDSSSSLLDLHSSGLLDDAFDFVCNCRRPLRNRSNGTSTELLLSVSFPFALTPFSDLFDFDLEFNCELFRDLSVGDDFDDRFGFVRRFDFGCCVPK